MLKKVILLGAFIGVSASVPILYQRDPDAILAVFSRTSADTEALADTRETRPYATAVSPSGRSVVLDPDPSGHFIGTFRLNGQKVDALIDTGASVVAMNLSTARRLGLNLRASDLKDSVDTANGRARATLAIVDRIEIGRVTVENVEAVVLEDSSLRSTLIGMTFLGRLKSYKVENGRLVLTQ